MHWNLKFAELLLGVYQNLLNCSFNWQCWTWGFLEVHFMWSESNFSCIEWISILQFKNSCNGQTTFLLILLTDLLNSLSWCWMLTTCVTQMIFLLTAMKSWTKCLMRKAMISQLISCKLRVCCFQHEFSLLKLKFLFIISDCKSEYEDFRLSSIISHSWQKRKVPLEHDLAISSLVLSLMSEISAVVMERLKSDTKRANERNDKKCHIPWYPNPKIEWVYSRYFWNDIGPLRTRKDLMVFSLTDILLLMPLMIINICGVSNIFTLLYSNTWFQWLPCHINKTWNGLCWKLIASCEP